MTKLNILSPKSQQSVKHSDTNSSALTGALGTLIAAKVQNDLPAIQPREGMLVHGLLAEDVYLRLKKGSNLKGATAADVIPARPSKPRRP